MTQEVERCQIAVNEAKSGKSVAVVSSGDSSVYGMASLIIEIANRDSADINIEIIPGITAALSVGAALGSPLSNDFSVISLSNLLTPKELILKRIIGAVNSDMVTVLYNPRSKKRRELIEIVIDHYLRVDNRLVAGFVKSCGREGEESWVGLLSEIPINRVDMLTTIIIGNSYTRIIDSKMVTLRGYENKYEI